MIGNIPAEQVDTATISPIVLSPLDQPWSGYNIASIRQISSKRYLPLSLDITSGGGPPSSHTMVILPGLNMINS